MADSHRPTREARISRRRLLCILFAICESPNMAVRGLVYGPELEENAGVVLGGIVDTDGTTGVGSRHGNSWNG